ncbi:GNAT family N-acetyltransferase [Candidatus Woesearchaeota archaeon]|nr:GNAT family N-acetyltransferase [Candidatus Woesearchaeota archaeon]
MKPKVMFLDDSNLKLFVDYLEKLPYLTYSKDVILDQKDVLSFKYYHNNTYIIAVGNIDPEKRHEPVTNIRKSKVIGHICIMHPATKHGYHQEHVLEVHINIMPEYQQKSVGKTLMKFLLKEVKKGKKKSGIKKIKTKMLANNEKVIKLFESFGFEKEAIMKEEWKLIIEDKETSKQKEVYEDGVYMSLFLD